MKFLKFMLSLTLSAGVVWKICKWAFTPKFQFIAGVIAVIAAICSAISVLVVGISTFYEIANGAVYMFPPMVKLTPKGSEKVG